MSLFTKIASTMLGTKISADTAKAGLPGVALGVVATRIMTRSPFGTLAVGAAYLGHKLWRKKQEIDALGPRGAAVKDGVAATAATKTPIAPPTPRRRRTKPAPPRKPATPQQQG